MATSKRAYEIQTLQRFKVGTENASKECRSLYGDQVFHNNTPPIYNETLKSWFCPAYFDNITCWHQTQANTTSIQSCPPYIAGFIKTENATRKCLENGTWFIHDEFKTYWTNYSSCANSPDTTITFELEHDDKLAEMLQNYVPIIKIMSETGYAVSLTTLIIAFHIMFFIKKLHCARNILHMHLFASFILRAFLTLLKDMLFDSGTGLAKDFTYTNGSQFFHIDQETSNWECKLLTSLWQYFVTANYSWILMEGLYLHNLIFRALFADSNRSIIHYIILGWGLPMLVVIPWIVCRVYIDDTLCWTTYDNPKIFWILAIPIIISIKVNLVLFTRISLILYSKLRSPINEDNRRYLKWAKSTLVLVPLFGAHYAILLGMSYTTNVIIYVIWLTCDQFFLSFQGFFVAVLYCFLNGEVKSELKPHLQYCLTYIATHRVFKFCFPCREKYLRTTVGRTSVCTTMSCSSLYTNGMLQRNNKHRWDFMRSKSPNPPGKDHICQNGNGLKHYNNIGVRRNSRSQSRCSQTGLNKQSQLLNLQSIHNIPVETTLCIEQRIMDKSIMDHPKDEEKSNMLP